MKRFWKPFISVLILGCAFMTTSCFDIVEAVSKNGTQYHFYWKISMANSMAEITGEEPGTMFDSIDEIEDFPFPNTSVKKFSNEYESGVEINFDASRNEKDSELVKFVPTEKGNNFILPISFADEMSKSFNDEDDMDRETKMVVGILLASFKYRIFIDKNILPIAKKAYFEKRNGGIQEVLLLDYGTNYSIEFPLILFTQNNELKLDAVIIEKR